MAMTGSGLAALIKSTLDAIDPSERDHDAVWNGIGDAIVAYIQANATVTVISVSGVTTGAGVSGAGTGTIS